MAYKLMVLLIFILGNGIFCEEGSPQIKALSLVPRYCYRLVPSFITSAVTPCSYPCLFLSPHERPHIVVNPEPDGTPCREGTCHGRVCRTTSPNAFLKRKKRFIGLYSIINLIKEKKSLKELKKEISRLRHEIAARRFSGVNNLGGLGAGGNGITRSGPAAGGGLSIGNQGNEFRESDIAAIGRSGTEGNRRTIIITLGNSLTGHRGTERVSHSRGLVSGSAPISLLGGFNRQGGDGRAIHTPLSGRNILLNPGLRGRDGMNRRRGGVPGDRLLGINGAASANRGEGVTASSDISSSNSVGGNFLTSRSGGNRVTGNAPNFPLVGTSGSSSVGYIGSGSGGLGVSSNRGPIGPSFRGRSNFTRPSIGYESRDTSVTGARANGVHAISGLGRVSSPGIARGNIGNRGLSTGGNGAGSIIHGRGSYSNAITNDFRTGGNGIGALGVSSVRERNSMRSVPTPTGVGNDRVDSSVSSSFERYGNSAGNGAGPVPIAFNAHGGSAPLPRDGGGVNDATTGTGRVRSGNENRGASGSSASLFEVDNV